MTDLLTRGNALLSDCGRYRYRLERRWGDGPACMFVMLNPSTADADQDDPTIRRCIGFARREGAGRLLVGNLYAYRATDPRDLKRATVNPIGWDNAQHIANMAAEAETVICAWGAHADPAHALSVLLTIRDAGRQPMALGLTAAGAPRHPLYLPKDAPLLPYMTPRDRRVRPTTPAAGRGKE